MTDIEKIKKEYHEKAPLYTDFCKELVNQVKFLLSENGIQTGFPLEFRVKAIDSVLDKIERNTLEINSLEEIKDFAGIRIICLFYNDLNLVEKLLKKNLIIHKTENTLNRLSDNTFGYGSIHFEASPKPEWLKIPTFKKHAQCRVEIQLRTASQHIWAAVSHTLQYKKETDIPLELRRTINRSAALLETVDLEFERVQNERNKYFSSIESKKKTKDDLNIDTLKYVLDQNLPPENRNINEDYSDLLNDLFAMGVLKMKELTQLIKKHLAKVKERNNEHIKESKSRDKTYNGVGFYHVGFVRHVLREEFGEKANGYFFNKMTRKR